MKYSIFDKNGTLDPDALKGGVYSVDLLQDNNSSVIHLYVGEAGCIIDRCGTHLRKFYNSPEYFGLKKGIVERQDLTLRFSVMLTLDKKEELWDPKYKNSEREIKDELNPITQIESSDSDKMRRTAEKVKLVDETMKEYGFGFVGMM